MTVTTTPTRFEIGNIVRLTEHVGTKAQRKMLWKITDLTANLHANVATIEPVTGGRSLLAATGLIQHASPAERTAAVNLPTAPKVVPGSVVTLQGKTGIFVVTVLSTAGTCTIVPIGGGRGYTKVAPMHLAIVTGTVEIPSA